MAAERTLKNGNKVRQLNVYIPSDIYSILKATAALRNIPLAQYVERCIAIQLKRDNP